MYLQAGALRETIRIQRPIERDGHRSAFHSADEWEDVCETRACIETLSGREVWQAEQAQSLLSHRVSIRFRSGIGGGMRVLYGDRVFMVEYAVELDNRHWLRLMCREIERSSHD